MHGGGYFYGLFIKAALYDSELSEARIWQKIYYSWSVPVPVHHSLFRIFRGGITWGGKCVCVRVCVDVARNVDIEPVWIEQNKKRKQKNMTDNNNYTSQYGVCCRVSFYRCFSSIALSEVPLEILTKKGFFTFLDCMYSGRILEVVTCFTLRFQK